MIKTKQDLLDFTKDSKVIVDFWAEWCGPCKMVGPVLEELTLENNLELLKINVDEHEQLANEFGITSIPAIMLIENGKIIKSLTGAKPKYALAKDLEL